MNMNVKSFLVGLILKLFRLYGNCRVSGEMGRGAGFAQR